MIILKPILLLASCFQLTAPVLGRLHGQGARNANISPVDDTFSTTKKDNVVGTRELQTISITVPDTATTIKKGTSLTFSKDTFTEIEIAGPITSSHQVTVQVTNGSVTLPSSTGSSGATVAVSGSSAAAVNTILDGIVYTPTSSFTGYDKVQIIITSGGSTVASKSFDVLVNAVIDVDAAVNALLAGVVSIHSGVQPGMITAYGPTVFNVMMFEGNINERGPAVVGSSFGAGRILVANDHQMLSSMQTYASESGTFYRNAVRWASGTSDFTTKIVTYEIEVNNWLISQGYTNVVKTTEANLISDLAGASLFVGAWLGTTEPDANIEALKLFAAAGGGLILNDYGAGYSWWWTSVNRLESPTSKLLRDVGIILRKDIVFINGLINKVQPPFQVTAADIPAAFADSNTLSLNAKQYILNYLLKWMKADLPRDNPYVRQADAAVLSLASNINPTSETPVTGPREKSLLNLERDLLMSTPASEVVPHRLAWLYGDIPAGAQRVTQTVEIDLGRTRWQATGLYAVPGELVTITVPDALVNKGFNIRVNAHTDDINKRDSWERPPVVHRFFEITSTTVEVANGFGGAIFVDLGGDLDSTPPGSGMVQITIANAIEHPYFDLTKGHTDADWLGTLRDKPAPYSVLVSKDIAIVQRSSESAGLTKPTELMQYWQKVIEIQDEMAGYVKPRTGNEIANVDVQIRAGIAHAGYPYMAEDKHWENLSDLDGILEIGRWGDFHELGHNHQSPYWNFWGDSETTVNIFSAITMRKLHPNYEPSIGSWEYKGTAPQPVLFSYAKSAVQSAAAYSQKNYDRFMFWIQLADLFGFETLRQVFMSYEQDEILGVTLPSTETEKKSEFYKRFSVKSGYDMTAYMVNVWGLEIDPAKKDEVGALQLPSWLPAMGSISSASTKINQAVAIDLGVGLMSYDNFAQIVEFTNGFGGTVTYTGTPGKYTYTPNSGLHGIDNFNYTVESSTGYQIKTEVEVHVVNLEEGTFEVNFPTSSGWSGLYYQHETYKLDNLPIYVREQQNLIMFHCNDAWRVTGGQYIAEVAGSSGCPGAIGNSLVKSQSRVSAQPVHPWEYSWKVATAEEPTWAFPPPPGDSYEFYYTD